MNHYVYQYIRNDGTPYYIGQGSGTRAYGSHRRIGGNDLRPKDKSKIIIIKDNLTEDQAKNLEVELIKKYGRKDLGTGILRNMTNGGDGATGRIYQHSTATRKKISSANKGKKKPPFSEEHKKNMSIAHTGKQREFSEEHKLNMRKPKIRSTCPHCNKEGALNALKRFHFQNCKELKNS